MDTQKLMSHTDTYPLSTQAEYVKKLRPLMPAEAFAPDPTQVWSLPINLAIVITGWEIADYLDQWDVHLLWLYLPLAIVMGNSVIVLLFSSHNLLHSSAVRNPKLRWILSLLGLTLLWTPPTFWKAVHNREHHNKTNSFQDPDRNYLYDQPKTWGKWIQNRFVPSEAVNPFWLAIGMAHAWGVHTFRNLSSVLVYNNGRTDYTSAAFTVSAKERKAIALELLFIIAFHLSVFVYLDFNPIKLLLGYFLPIWIGYSGILFYVYTNHMLCRMTQTNDPLANSLSIRVPRIFDLLHHNFSYHTEHHIFPGMNSDYYPMLQKVLKENYPEQFNLLEAKTAWRLLLQSPRHYKDDKTFTDWTDTNQMVCPLSAEESRRELISDFMLSQ
ncbi:MAG: fatty acid desaturase [Phormidesmis priestleyi]|uniref:Fatty acid desaturase n=1 Tax=Phormidesmis priestleyi TaxID=268141 RepID=A0A2W4X0F5_9CYAN|nr:MAG: fatty acid desaturase [Phormidesmis priestleyi]